jgi:hypothetical protein
LNKTTKNFDRYRYNKVPYPGSKSPSRRRGGVIIRGDLFTN